MKKIILILLTLQSIQGFSQTVSDNVNPSEEESEEISFLEAKEKMALFHKEKSNSHHLVSDCIKNSTNSVKMNACNDLLAKYQK